MAINIVPPSDDPRGRSKHDKIRRLRTRLSEAGSFRELYNVLKGVIDLLEDEL